MPESQAKAAFDSGLMWQAEKGRESTSRASCRKKVVGEPDEGKPHVRFEVAGDGNQDMVWVIEALSKETESKQAARPKSQAPSPDPTTRRGYRRSKSAASRAFRVSCGAGSFPHPPRG